MMDGRMNRDRQTHRDRQTDRQTDSCRFFTVPLKILLSLFIMYCHILPYTYMYRSI